MYKRRCFGIYAAIVCGFVLVVITSVLVKTFPSKKLKQPHIIYILADDLGWDDVSFRGSSELQTPNIDALAYSGLILNRFYGQPMCTPSRSALYTGKYPIHTGMQHFVLLGGEPRGLPLSEKLLPEYLNDLGYESHLVGKWHLGFYKEEYTPSKRGFKTHLGYWNGMHDYFDHFTRTKFGGGHYGLDMRRNMEPAWDLHGNYSTDIFTERSLEIIRDHDSKKPLFLMLAQIAPHFGSDYNPTPIPDEMKNDFKYIKDEGRRRYAVMVKKLDECVGRVLEGLKKKGILEESLIVFSSDNGGLISGVEKHGHGSNWPLRGSKTTLWEGGVRLPSIVWSKDLSNKGGISDGLMHLADWLPTFVAAAGGTIESNTILDGVNQWNMLRKGEPSSRSEVLLNIDPIENTSAIIYKNWKLIKGSAINDFHYGPIRKENKLSEEYKESVRQSRAGKAFADINYPPLIDNRSEDQFVHCKKSDKDIDCRPSEASCLFDIVKDPCEYNNIAKFHPEIVSLLERKLLEYNSTAHPPSNMPELLCSIPSRHNMVWSNFGDLGCS